MLLSGEASAHVVADFVASTPLGERVSVLPVKNAYFGGNVNVTGLLTAQDVLAALPQELAGTVVLIPDIMLNTDALTLDGVSSADLVAAIGARGGRALVLQATPEGIAGRVGDL